MPELIKGSGDPKEPPKGDPSVIDSDNPTPEDIKNLQKALSEKDVKLKQLESDLKNLKDAEQKRADEEKKKQDEKKTEAEKEMEKMRADMKTMSDTLKVFNESKRKDDLKEKYPDIEPDLLVGKTDEQAEKVVEKQREMNKKNYGDSKFFIKPEYESEEDVQQEIDKVKKDETLRGDQSAVKVLHLMREKLNFKK